ncbi:Sensor protein CpxA [compost metagenome]
MVKRSLVLKIGLSVSLVFFACVPITLMAGHHLKQQGRHESIRNFITPQLEAIGQEVTRSLNGQPPTLQQLEELGRAARHRIRFVPWEKSAGYPEALKAQAILVDVRPAREGPAHWVRLDFEGRPFGALELKPAWRTPPRQMPPGPPGMGPTFRDDPPPPGMGPIFRDAPAPPGPPYMPPPAPGLPEFALLWLALLGLAIVPPLWIWVIRPLKAMVAMARRLGSGDLDTQVPVRRSDEFGELERAFESMRVELRRAIQQRERLLTDVSHEIRGPLTRMTLALPLLQQQGASGAILELFERELKAANDMLGDVLALARGRSRAALNRVPVDLAEIARQVIDERRIVAQQHGLELSADLQPAPMVADERLIARAMGNLLDNALKYTGEGGRIHVSTQVSGARIVFTVTDNGPGIADEHLPSIFEPFYRPDDSRSRETGGTGLGLSIVRGIAENHGGTASLASTLGQGTRATISFPQP